MPPWCVLLLVGDDEAGGPPHQEEPDSARERGRREVQALPRRSSAMLARSSSVAAHAAHRVLARAGRGTSPREGSVVADGHFLSTDHSRPNGVLRNTDLRNY